MLSIVLTVINNTNSYNNNRNTFVLSLLMRTKGLGSPMSHCIKYAILKSVVSVHV